MKLPKITEIQRWGLINGIFASLVVLGPGFEVPGTTNLALFIAWLNFILSTFMLHPEAVTIAFRDNDDPINYIPVWVDVLFDSFIIGVFLWNDFWFTGIAYTIHTLLLFGFREKIKEHKNELERKNT